jgi:hypothetical protein
MELFLNGVLKLHIFSGFLGLFFFWIPVFTKKGGKIHRKFGLGYVYSMWAVIATSVILSIENFLTGNPILGAFLGFIAILTANPLWYGIAILKHKKQLTKRIRNTHVMLNILLVSAAFSMVIYGIFLQINGSSVVLLYIFGGFGLLGIPSIVKEFKEPSFEREWFKDHLVSMCISGIAAFTAFLVFGANSWMSDMLKGSWSIVPWVAPGIIGTIGIVSTVRYYRNKGVIK